MIKEFFSKLVPKVYKWRNGDDRRSFGFLAQDLLKIFPLEEYDVVVKDPRGIYMVNYNQLIPILVGKIKELESRIEALEKKE